MTDFFRGQLERTTGIFGDTDSGVCVGKPGEGPRLKPEPIPKGGIGEPQTGDSQPIPKGGIGGSPQARIYFLP
jgi:hypothetical protein